MFSFEELEDGFLVEYDCGCKVFMEEEDFFDMLEAEGIEIIYDEDEDFDECEFCDDCDFCEFDEEIDVVDEIDEELIELMDEMRELREVGDYEGYAILAEAYAVLYSIIYE